jgi:UDP-N-acetylmuramoyl-tripeptide--D-alanyl-D-alanine ligase
MKDFFRNLWTRYHPNYVRALIYMLQANEYYPFEYMAWYHRTSDFYNIEKRKHLVYTLKAILLSVFAWFSLLWGIGTSAYVAYQTGLPGVIAAIVGFILGPFIVPYTLFILIVVLNWLQKPIEAYIIARAKAKLRKMNAVKIGIAGSFGKTTMREILKAVLSEGRRVAAPGGSHNTPLAIARFIESLNGNEEVLVFEFGEYYPGDIKKLCKFVDPDWGVITGVNEAHLERFGTVERASGTIFELADYLKAKSGSHMKGSRTKDILVYVNAEGTVKPRDTESYILYSGKGTDTWKVEHASTGIEGTVIDFSRSDSRVQVHSRLLGLHNTGPLSAAADIAARLGLTVEQIQAGILATKPFEHRIQPRVDGGVIWIDDSYNGNPDGAAAAIEFLKTLKGHRRFYVTPGLVEMGSRKEEIHREMGRKLAEAEIEKVVLIRDSVTPYIEQGLKEAGYKGEILWYDFGPTAYNALPKMTVAGDVILIQNDWPDQYV